MRNGTRPTIQNVSQRIECGIVNAVRDGLDEFLQYDLERYFSIGNARQSEGRAPFVVRGAHNRALDHVTEEPALNAAVDAHNRAARKMALRSQLPEFRFAEKLANTDLMKANRKTLRAAFEWDFAAMSAVACYLGNPVESIAINALRQRLSTIAELDCANELPGSTLRVWQLAAVIQAMEAAAAGATGAEALRLTRDKALILVGYWGGFQANILRRLQVEHIKVIRGERIELVLPAAKNEERGLTFCVPSFSQLCPVAAYTAWLEQAGLIQGPVFRRIDAEGRLQRKPLLQGSIVALVQQRFAMAAIKTPKKYRGHSLWQSVTV